MERKTSEEINNILLNEFNNYLLNEKAESWIKEYSNFNFTLKKETKKVELKVDLRKEILEDNMFWEYKDGSRQLVKLNNNGTKTYYISYDIWEDVTIFVAEICLLNLNVETIYKESKLSSLNQNDFFI
ncbi:hypothetical protein [Chryseobacterium arthrosphaerae]|uniref:hypothetical protein n=1 Tax=Chryseobacterium arthrosphaerae TaxID=651561 RepID=UPI001BB054FA|nr:hypothetical protein [Chryseobacterium arthrosphaerae]QUY53715.1 hypothetical protein I2F65_12540 [Chryseobacterium arthrosphaerae]UEQ78218.1 hypothetical protein J8N07_07975 [Chryseobacterium arthrosphaerae]